VTFGTAVAEGKLVASLSRAALNDEDYDMHEKSVSERLHIVAR